MSQPSVDPALIHLIGIRIIKEHLESSEEFLEFPVQVESFVFGHDYNQSLNLDTNGLRARLFLRLKAVNDKNEDLGLEAEYGVEFHFMVDNLNDFVEKQENEVIKLRGALSATLAGISYSSARGIVWEKLSGTAFSHIVLPVINPSELLQQ